MEIIDNGGSITASKSASDSSSSTLHSYPNSCTRCIAHLDLDCFYVQVERKRHPELIGMPCAVVQYNPYKGGGIIALSYEAKKKGVKRSMRGEEARKVCPEIQLVQVDVKREKADLSVYREAGTKVFELCSRADIECERVSIDEAYLDVTKAARKLLGDAKMFKLRAQEADVMNKKKCLIVDGTTTTSLSKLFWEHAFNNSCTVGDPLLAAGSVIVAEIRDHVRRETSYELSAGIAHNKMLAKLFSGKNKPNKQTLVPRSKVKELISALPLRELNGFGGKLGDELIEKHKLQYVGDLLQKTIDELYTLVPFSSRGAKQNTAKWMWNACRGICNEPVKSRIAAKSTSCGKTFHGPERLHTIDEVSKFISKLAEEVAERLLDAKIKYCLYPKTLTISYSTDTSVVKRKGVEVTLSGGEGATRSCAFPGLDKNRIASKAISLVKRELTPRQLRRGVTSLYIGASNLFEITSKGIEHFLKPPKKDSMTAPDEIPCFDDVEFEISSDFSGFQDNYINRVKLPPQDLIRNKFSRHINNSDKLFHKATSHSKPPGLSQAKNDIDWSDVDVSVFSSLPCELQKEIEKELGNKPKVKIFKQENLGKRQKRNQIEDYFIR